MVYVCLHACCVWRVEDNLRDFVLFLFFLLFAWLLGIELGLSGLAASIFIH